MGYSRKKTGGRGWGYTFFNLFLPRWNFSFFYFTPGNSRQSKVPPLEIPQIFLTSLGNSKVKNQETKTPGNSTNFSLVALGNSTSFLINPWKFHMLFVWYHCKFHILNLPPPPPPHLHPVCFFFGTAQCVQILGTYK